MAAGHIILPCMPAEDINGDRVAGALLYFYVDGTTTPKAVYTSSAMTTPHANPVVADDAGVFPEIFGDDADLYTVTCFSPAGVMLPGGSYSSVRPNVSVISDPLSGALDALAIEAVSAAAADLVPQYVSAKNFGALGNGLADDTAALNTWLQYLRLNDRVGFLPAGDYKTTGTIWQAAPDFIAAPAADGLDYSYAVRVVGESPGANTSGYGARILPTTNDFIAWYIGPGNGMELENVLVCCPGVSYWQNTDNGGRGILVASGQGGATRTRVFNCTAQGFYYGMATGLNRDSLGDSNVFSHCYVFGCHYGITVNAPQNYIDTLDCCTIQQCKIAAHNPTNKIVAVTGNNNFSTYAAPTKAHTIGTHSAFTDTSGAGVYALTFTAVIASPDTYMSFYDVFAMDTTFFGIVPFELVSYNSTTHVITLGVPIKWKNNHYAILNLLTATDIQASLTAVTTLYCAAKVTTFSGGGFLIEAYHGENPTSVTTLYTGGRDSEFGALFVNNDPAHSDYRGSGSADLKALYYCQFGVPFVDVTGGQLTVRTASASYGEGKAVFRIASDQQAGVDIHKTIMHFTLECRPAGGSEVLGDGANLFGRGRGAGTYDANYFPPAVSDLRSTYRSGTELDSQYRSAYGGHDTPYAGYFPAKYATPWLPPVARTLVTSALGTVGNYPMLEGRRPYRVGDHGGIDASGKLFMASDHELYSWGKDITAAWSYRGQSSVLRFTTPADAKYFQPGQKITIDNGGGDAAYIVTGAFPLEGYVTVMAADGSLLAGSKTTTFTGATVKQAAYSIAYY